MMREEIRQAGPIAASKPFPLEAKFENRGYALLNQLWSSPDTYADLPKSAAEAAQFFRAQKWYTTQKLF